MKIEKFYLFLLACFVAIGAYSQDGQQKMTGDEKSQQQSDAKVKITGQVFDESGRCCDAGSGRVRDLCSS